MTNFLKLKKTKILLGIFLILIIACYFILQNQLMIFKVCFPDKTWAHRVNSIEKFQEARTKYSGIETDIVFDSINTIFDVNHPPAESINLSLEAFFNSNKNNSELGFWLDFKNLSFNNQFSSLNRLDYLIKTLNIKPHSIIIESTNPQYLEKFAKKGFKTSYYMPTNISRLEKHELSKIKLKIKKNTIEFITASSIHYEFLKSHFPNTKKLTWILNEPPNINSFYTLKRSFINFKNNLSLFRDSNVEVVLLRFKAQSGNR